VWEFCAVVMAGGRDWLCFIKVLVELLLLILPFESFKLPLELFECIRTVPDELVVDFVVLVEVVVLCAVRGCGESPGLRGVPGACGGGGLV